MSDQAIMIYAQMVGWRNDPRHKGSIEITCHVPVEGGNALLAFPWPTYQKPIPVAIALLNPHAAEEPADRETGTTLPGDKVGEPVSRPPFAGALAREVAMACNDPAFVRYLIRRGFIGNANDAPNAVRRYCGVKSRNEIVPHSPAAELWRDLYDRFLEELPEEAA